MNKRITVLSGVSGTGKTYHRTHELAHLPFVDIADVYRENPFIERGAMATCALWDRAEKLLEENDEIVIEGYFLKGSESRRWLVSLAHRSYVEVEIINFWAPLDTCEARIRGQVLRGDCSPYEGEMRISLLKKCWRPKGE